MTDPGSRLRAWWRDDPRDPGRLTLADKDVQCLIAKIDPGGQAIDLGGVMSLNVHLMQAGLVLRVHQPFVSRERLLALQVLRRELSVRGILVAEPVTWRGVSVVHLRDRWAELEQYVPHTPPPGSAPGYRVLFRALGQLHAVMRQVPLRVPRPVVATYAPPGSLRRWQRVTQAAVRHDAEAAALADRVHAAIGRVGRTWVSQTDLPQSLIHGDGSPRNIGWATDGRAVYLDWGFCGVRPRVYEIAYALAFMLVRRVTATPGGGEVWEEIPQLVGCWEDGAGERLLPLECQALSAQMASALLYAAALDGYTEDPAGRIKGRERFVALAEEVLARAGWLALGQAGGL